MLNESFIVFKRITLQKVKNLKIMQKYKFLKGGKNGVITVQVQEFDVIKCSYGKTFLPAAGWLLASTANSLACKAATRF